MVVNGAKGRDGDAAASGESEGNVKTFQRWNATRKRDVVLRLLRGESLDAISREVGVEIAKLDTWRNDALEAMEAGLRARGQSAPNRELEEAVRRVGELTMEVELLRRRCDLARPSPPRRSKP